MKHVSPKERKDRPASSPLERTSAAVGLVLTLAMLGVIGWRMLVEPDDQLPAVVAEVRSVIEVEDVHVVAIRARNMSPATAANVTVVGSLEANGSLVQSSRLTLDYVPGNSSRDGGLFFTVDPAEHELRLRVTAYTDP